jgi:hypothetical protein
MRIAGPAIQMRLAESAIQMLIAESASRSIGFVARNNAASLPDRTDSHLRQKTDPSEADPASGHEADGVQTPRPRRFIPPDPFQSRRMSHFRDASPMRERARRDKGRAGSRLARRGALISVLLLLP